MTQPYPAEAVEIMARAVWSDFETTSPFDALSPEIKENVRGEMRAVIAALEAAGYRLLSAEGVTDEMANPIKEMMRDLFNKTEDGVLVPISEEKKWRTAKSIASLSIRAAPLFGKGSEKK